MGIPIDGMRILITGGSKGIGRALARGLADGGAKVVISGRHDDSLTEAAGDRPITIVQGDVAAPHDAERMVEACVEAHGGIDVVVNNAAVLTDPRPVAQTTAEEWRHVLDVNVIGSVNVAREALPHLEAQGQGVIINVSSTWGRSAAADVAPYCASKFAIEGLSQSLAAETSAGIIVLALNPGVINTEMLASAFQADVSAYPSPESLLPAWEKLFAALDHSWSGRSIDLAMFS